MKNFMTLIVVIAGIVLGQAGFPFNGASAKEPERAGVVFSFGLYSAIQTSDMHQGWLNRIKELQSLGVNTVIGGPPLRGPKCKTLVQDLHAHGIKIALRVTDTQDWFGPHGKGDFDPSKAEIKLKEASPLSECLDYLYLAHEVHEFASHDERVRMYALAKRYFPNTPVMMYYGGAIERMRQKADTGTLIRKHKREYQFGPGEADIVLFAVRGSAAKSDVKQASERIQRVREIVGERDPAVKVWGLVSFAPDKKMNSDKSSMWTAAEIRAFGGAVMQSGHLDGLFFRSYGRFKYDLGYPEWEEQRKAFQSLSPVKIEKQ